MQYACGSDLSMPVHFHGFHLYLDTAGDVALGVGHNPKTQMYVVLGPWEECLFVSEKGTFDDMFIKDPTELSVRIQPTPDVLQTASDIVDAVLSEVESNTVALPKGVCFEKLRLALQAQPVFA